MRREDSAVQLSASDLSGQLGCQHLTLLDLEVVRGHLAAPQWRDPSLVVLQQRGLEHEQAYVAHLAATGCSVVRSGDDGGFGAGVQRTREAMRSRADAIVQAALGNARWVGRADVLRRVDVPSELGSWSYEVVDTKLTAETRSGTILQLCLYSELLADLQGRLPERMHVVAPGNGLEPQTFRVSDYTAYYRWVKSRLLAVVDSDDPSTLSGVYPEPVAQCEFCRWWSRCDARRRADDHLSLIAGISKLQLRELQSRSLMTLETVAKIDLPLNPRPRRGAMATYERVREQARIQLEGRTLGEPVYELLPRQAGFGLARLPKPSTGDIFLDFEGDPFIGEHGLEYLFGYVLRDGNGEWSYRRRWVLNPEQERAAFVELIDLISERWATFPDFHIYHFAPYEPAAIKRMMGRYALRGEEVDRMLRGKLFVDLHAIVKQALRASVERYSLKELEPLFGFGRLTELRTAAEHLRLIQRRLELGDPEPWSEESCGIVEGYNREDCLSALALRDWLEGLRAELIDTGEEVARPEAENPEASVEIGEQQQKVEHLRQLLCADVPVEVGDRSDEQQARWLLAYMLDWHRCEDKSEWWEYFRLCELSDDDLLHERCALAGLQFVERLEVGRNGNPTDRYSYVPQDNEFRGGERLHLRDKRSFGNIAAVDHRARIIDVKKGAAVEEEHPTAVFAHNVVGKKELAESLMRMAEWVVANGIDAPGLYRAARDLLLRRHPRLADRAPTTGDLQRPGEPSLAAARRLALALDGGTLPLQGPPGTGKTYTGARMICELVKAGKRVGVTAVSHKVIGNLLDKVVEAAAAEGVALECAQKVADLSTDGVRQVREEKDSRRALTLLADGEAQVLGGTAWLWARADATEAVDVLFVDEAGQMSLVDVVAVAPAAKSVVLLGDPQQLDQPQQGSHPDGTEVSALQHLLGADKTVPSDRGLFLAETYRLAPAICDFTSEVFYEGRLHPVAGLERQALIGTPMAGAGLWVVPVSHDGNQNASSEEVARIAEIVTLLTGSGSRWIDRHGAERQVTLEDILIVAPYNAQVTDIARAVPNARAGTVDKFQGQEAPIVIYSMATSTPEDAPHGMEFLYSLNRLNVATSRAQCGCILLASPRLFEPECRTPRQMQLANALCRYVEMSSTLDR